LRRFCCNFSRVSGIEDGTLVSLGDAAASFPAIPGVEFTAVVDEYNLLDFGSLLTLTGGIMQILPPILGSSYKILVPKPDQDGIEIAGVHQVELQASLGHGTSAASAAADNPVNRSAHDLARPCPRLAGQQSVAPRLLPSA
jgi:hypothetical protein